MIALSLTLISGIRSAALHAIIALMVLYGHVSTANTVRKAPCFVAITAVVSTPAPYRITRVVTTGVREYDDDGAGSVAYCEPRDVARLRAAREAVDRQIRAAEQSASQNIEHVVIRSTSPTVVVQHLTYVAASAAKDPSGFAGIEVVALKDVDGTEYREHALPSLLQTDSARTACANANAALLRSASPFHWAC